VVDGEFLNRILLGDCLEVLKKLPDASVDSIVTDPPYGLGTREPRVEEIVAYLSGGNLDTGGDFMGRDWSVPSVATWKECFRVLKPGGHLLSFGGTRTFDLISMGIRAAGFESRDTVASQFGVQVLQWIHGQGFPKSLDIAKVVGKINGHAEQWKGWGTALKPSWEPILVFRKPIEEKTVAEQVLKTGMGGLNIDACRVKLAPEENVDKLNSRSGGRRGFSRQYVHGGNTGNLPPGCDLSKGRWPANLIFTHTEDCKVVGYKKVPAPVINRWTDGAKPFGNGAGHPFESEQMGDADGMEEIPIYECAEGCPVKELDEQSGVIPQSYRKSRRDVSESSGVNWRIPHPEGRPIGYRDSGGGASRFFGQIQPETPFQYVAKASRKERNLGLLPGEQNKHPTVKPLKLAEWLVKLVTPKGGVTLDPFCGSGTVCIAAIRCGCNYIGVDKDRESCATAIQRIAGGVVGPGQVRKKKVVSKKKARPGKKQRQLKLGIE
jgi:DNA modification methylase